MLPPHTPVRPILPFAPYSLPPQPRFNPTLPSALGSLPPQPPVRPRLHSAPASRSPHAPFRQRASVDICLSAEVECDGAALARCSASMCECAAQMRGGSQAHPLPSCAPVVARLAVHARSHSMAPNRDERSRTRTMANTPLARRLRDESGSPCPHTVIKHAFGRQKSPVR